LRDVKKHITSDPIPRDLERGNIKSIVVTGAKGELWMLMLPGFFQRILQSQRGVMAMRDD